MLRNKSKVIIGGVSAVVVVLVLYVLDSLKSFLFPLDQAIYQYFLVHTSFVPFMRALTLFGDWPVLIPVGVFVSLLLHKRDRIMSLVFASSMILLQVFVYSIKHVSQYARPAVNYVVENTYSFPSGHTLSSWMFFSLLAYLIMLHVRMKGKVWLMVGCFVVAFLMSVSRLVLSVHWYSDIVLSFLLFVPLFIISTLIFQYFEEKK